MAIATPFRRPRMYPSNLDASRRTSPASLNHHNSYMNLIFPVIVDSYPQKQRVPHVKALARLATWSSKRRSGSSARRMGSRKPVPPPGRRGDDPALTPHRARGRAACPGHSRTSGTGSRQASRLTRRIRTPRRILTPRGLHFLRICGSTGASRPAPAAAHQDPRSPRRHTRNRAERGRHRNGAIDSPDRGAFRDGSGADARCCTGTVTCGPIADATAPIAGLSSRDGYGAAQGVTGPRSRRSAGACVTGGGFRCAREGGAGGRA